jgi:ElaB/YqjD/DUF883 family membrane-anchored ribosome-binding protein
MSQEPITNDSGVSAAGRLASMAHDTIDRVAPKISRAEQEVRSAAARTADGAKNLQAQAVEATEQGLASARSYIESNPLTTAIIAFAAGALLSSLVRR